MAVADRSLLPNRLIKVLPSAAWPWRICPVHVRLVGADQGYAAREPSRMELKCRTLTDFETVRDLSGR